MTVMVPCPSCGGTGLTPKKRRCPYCNGRGYTIVDKLEKPTLGDVVKVNDWRYKDDSCL